MPENMTSQTRIEEPGTKLREAYTNSHLVNVLVLCFQMISSNSLF
jgi:hypothetical protein